MFQTTKRNTWQTTVACHLLILKVLCSKQFFKKSTFVQKLINSIWTFDDRYCNISFELSWWLLILSVKILYCWDWSELQQRVSIYLCCTINVSRQCLPILMLSLVQSLSSKWQRLGDVFEENIFIVLASTPDICLNITTTGCVKKFSLV